MRVTADRKRRHRVARRSCALIAFSFAVLLRAPFVHAQAAATEDPWRIVILNNADYLFPASTIMDQALRENLGRLSPRPLDLYGETLDLLRYPAATETELVALLRRKHSGHRVDLVMARAQTGLEFALKYGSELWPGVPIVFYNNIGDRYPAGSRMPRDDITGILIDLDPAGTLDLVQRLHPGTRRLYIVGGTSPYDLSWKERVQSLLAERKDAFDAVWLDRLPLPELTKAVGRLPADSVILYTSMLRDASGQERVSAQIAELIARLANVPVYGFLDTHIGRGIVGGDIPDFAAEGREAAKLALRVLQGEAAASIPVQPAPPAHCVVDARALERWRIDGAKLPSDCEVRFGQPSVWRDHAAFVAGAVAALLLQTVLIGGLLIQRRRLAQAKAVDVARRTDVERALAFERLLVEISAALLRDRASNPDAAIEQALQRIGEFLHVERAALWSLSADRERYEPTHRWISAGVGSTPAFIDKAMAPATFSRVSEGQVVALSSIEELPAEADVEKREFRRFGTRSVLIVPLKVEGYVVGALSLSAVLAERDWDAALIPRVQLMGEVFANVLTRRRYESKMQEARSEAAQYRERLAHLARVHTVGEMSAAIAHEVNQPLVAIENYALAARRRLAPESATESSKLGELLAKIGNQAARAGDVLKKLRAIVKKHESEVTQFDLGALVAETAYLVEIESRLRDIRVDITVASGLPPVLADEIQIQQVILNLARNGIEAMDEPGIDDKVLRVEVQRCREQEVLVRVIDHGRGVTEADRERIFEPFYSTKEKGLGIGLAICRSIVEAHGGKLSYAPNPAGGATFEFTLPTADEKVEQ